MAKKPEERTVFVAEVKRSVVTFCIVGESPLILHRLAEKARRELLLPHGRKNAAERATTLKHDPLEEFRSSPHVLRSPDEPTYLALDATALKKAMGTAALDLPGTKKAQIGRLCYVEGRYLGVYGIPKLLMSPVRSSDMARTPDIRTRAILDEWAMWASVTYHPPLISDDAVTRLLVAAGMVVGVGDWRPEKGSGAFGRFRLTSAEDADFLRITKAGGRAAQIEAMEAAEPYDDETEELLSWYGEEITRRQSQGRTSKAKATVATNGGTA